MRNLQQVEHANIPVSNLACVCCKNEDLITLEISESTATLTVIGADAPFAKFDVPDLSPDIRDRVIDMHYSEVDDNLCIVMAGGDIILASLDSAATEPAVEILGTIDDEVLAAQWSPDNEILAVATRSTLNLLTQQFDTLAKVNLEEKDIRLSTNQVSVGWGRSETQFRGKKAARDPTLPDIVDTGRMSERDSGRVELSWRGDASHVCMSTTSKNRRVIWVFSRDGVLESTSEPVDNQLDFVSWKADGSLITAVQHRLHTNYAIFFEKNGLRHGEFDLRSDLPVLGLSWNCDNTVLAVLYSEYIDLWTCGNYHYYLKAKLDVSGTGSVVWHNEDSLHLLWYSEGSLTDMRFAWKCTTHQVVEPNDFGLVGVVDGQSLGLTPLRLANVPPPLSFRDLRLPEVPKDVAISSDTNLLIILYNSRVDFYAWRLSDRPVKIPALVRSIQMPISKNASLLQVAHSKDGRTFVLDSRSSITEITSTGLQLFHEAPTSIFIRAIYPCEKGLMMQMCDGHIKHSEGLGSSTVLSTSARSYELMDTYEPSQSSQKHVIGLTQAGELFIDAECARSKVTSFILLGSLLLYTRSLELNFLDMEKAISKDDLAREDSMRSIERGSILLCGCPSAQSVVLQAPRGNLETIYPRQLVIGGLKNLILADEWQKAWRLIKVHRIDPNFLCDYRPELFLNQLLPIIAGLHTSTELDIFLTALRPENVCETMYASFTESAQNGSFNSDKVNTICDAVLETLQNAEDPSYFSSVLTSHLCKLPPDYKGALSLTAKLPQSQKDDAIIHLCFLADPQLLYRQALELYDLQSALLFAQKSQKDPREYVPFLRKIQSLSIVRQHFTLDDHLGLFSKAIISLLEIEDAWEECTAYIQKHELWRIALHAIRYDAVRYKKLLKLYAQHLMDLQEFSDAGFAFEQVEDALCASEAFERAGYWIEALHNASVADLPVVDVARRLKDQLIDQARYVEAAQISRHHLSDDDAAISLYCRAYEFSDAIYLAGTAARIQRLVHPLVVESFSQTSELLSEMRTQLHKQVPRLRDVRRERENDSQNYFEGAADDDAPDNVSLADTQGTTNASFFTRYTGATAMTTQSKKSGKARRRQERQRAKGKKGTIWEEEYLVNSIRRLIERLETDRKDIKNLVIALVRCNLRENAAELQGAATSLIAEVRSYMDEVFSVADTLPEELSRLTVEKPKLSVWEPFQLC